MIRTTAARIHPWLAGLFALGVLLQAFLAGAALPQLGGSGDFATHRDVGYTAMGILALVVLIVGGISRASRLQIWGSIGLFVLYVIQTLLPAMAGSQPTLAALHPVNAVLLFGLAAWMFVQERRPTAT